ncbi:hypothetical protein D6C78_06991 [Aureobasidium pullulans]|uniref:Uncharacterized protein n=1 Tax=Aureobasidium pullulans TaxID=5580 RepID=A0A4S9HTV7_AURPU|nr:hypothetical protein D6D04_05256 [Aureobasidium pullulans]TIA34228.1 hypothetical protein D6C78_06991 [Aureobasidium pullulans]
MWAKIKTYLCCGEEDETERPVFVIGEPFGFERNEVILPGLTAEEQSMINSRPVAPTYPINPDGTAPIARLDRARAHTRAISSSLRSARSNAMSSVGHRSSGYSALANTSPSTAQPHKADDDEVPHEMKELCPRDAGGPETSSSFTGKGSVETAIAGCEEDDDGGRSFGRTK